MSSKKGVLSPTYIHGESIPKDGKQHFTRLYSAWHHMKDDKSVQMDGDWKNDFRSFRDWALKNGYDESIGMCHFRMRDRNVGWTTTNTTITPVVSANGIFLTHNGMTMNIAQWGKFLGISKQLLWFRLFKKHCSVEEALTTPVMNGREKSDYAD